MRAKNLHFDGIVTLISGPEAIGDDLNVLECPGVANCLDELAVFHHVLFPVALYVRLIGYNRLRIDWRCPHFHADIDSR